MYYRYPLILVILLVAVVRLWVVLSLLLRGEVSSVAVGGVRGVSGVHSQLCGLKLGRMREVSLHRPRTLHAPLCTSQHNVLSYCCKHQNKSKHWMRHTLVFLNLCSLIFLPSDFLIFLGSPGLMHCKRWSQTIYLTWISKKNKIVFRNIFLWKVSTA